MNIASHSQAQKVTISPTMTAWEYPVLDDRLHGAVVELSGRYPNTGRVVNDLCTEIGYVISGQGKVVIEDQEIEFQQGDQLLIKPGEKYFWDVNATLFMPCAPAWYPEQHREVE